ncbi:hypothetical protein DXG01_012721, partial [Tephrocybe rancida]
PQDLNLVAVRPVVPQLALNPDGQNNLLLCANNTRFQLQDLNRAATKLVIPQLALNPDAATKGSQVCYAHLTLLPIHDNVLHVVTRVVGLRQRVSMSPCITKYPVTVLNVAI